MDIFIYAIIFIIGTFFGSFFTLAVYRIPKKEDILIKHSYCPNCNNRLGFFDLFPVLSYIFLKGKCRYCGNKIRPRYLILELLSGLSFLILAIGVKVNILDIFSVINVIFLLLYVSVLFIIAGIDKENIKIEKTVLIFGFIVEILYIIYQYILNVIDVYQYVIYLLSFILILGFLKFYIKSNKTYIIQNLYLSLYMIIGSGIIVFIYTILLTILGILFWKKVIKKEDLSLGFLLSVNNILIIAISNIFINYIL